METSTLKREVAEQPEVELRVTGLRLDIPYKEVELDEESGIPFLKVGTNNTIRLFGTGFSEDMLVIFTSEPGKYNGTCQTPATKYFPVSRDFLG